MLRRKGFYIVGEFSVKKRNTSLLNHFASNDRKPLLFIVSFLIVGNRSKSSLFSRKKK